MPLYRYLVRQSVTRRAFAIQLSSCLQLQLFIIKLYCLYKNNFRPFLQYLSSYDSSPLIKYQIARVINSVDEVSFSIDLQQYFSIQQFSNSSKLDQIHTIIGHSTQNIHPCIIYYKESFGEYYIVLHYFTIIYSNDTYWLLSSWGVDSFCVTPAVIEIDLAEFTTLLSLLSDHDKRIANKELFASLMTKYFFSTPHKNRSTDNEIPQKLLSYISSDIDYYGGIIPGYIEEIDQLIKIAIKSRNRITIKKPRTNKKTRKKTRKQTRKSMRRTYRNKTIAIKSRNRITFKKPRTNKQTRKQTRK